MVPFVKWVGGKKRILKHLEKIWPKEYDTYFEPFVGGGAALFHFQPKKAIINDLNTELINLYKVIASKATYKRFRELLLILESGHHVMSSKGDAKGEIKKISPFYNIIASIDRNESGLDRKLSLKDSTKEFRAARFLFLNKNNFNGLYRVNGSGFYNSPSKHTPTRTFVEKNIKNISTYLRKSVKIKNKNFTSIVEGIKKGDFVYFDPPYDYEKGEKGFDAYQKGGFGIDGQMELANLCKELHKKGIKFLVSNHPTELIKGLYEEFEINIITVNRLIGGKKASRKPVKEVLVKNY